MVNGKPLKIKPETSFVFINSWVFPVTFMTEFKSERITHSIAVYNYIILPFYNVPRMMGIVLKQNTHINLLFTFAGHLNYLQFQVIIN